MTPSPSKASRPRPAATSLPSPVYWAGSVGAGTATWVDRVVGFAELDTMTADETRVSCAEEEEGAAELLGPQNCWEPQRRRATGQVPDQPGRKERCSGSAWLEEQHGP